MLNGNDLELLSAYLDGALSETERATLEARLQTDADLQRELDRLRATVALIKRLPTLPAPRPLTLTPRMVRRPSILTSAAFSALSAAAAVILLVIGAALFTTTSAPGSPVARNLVAALPTVQLQSQVNEPQAAANSAVVPPVVADNLQVTMAKSTTQVGQEAAGGSNFAAASTETPQPTVAALLYAAPLTTDTFGAEDLQADGSVSPVQPGQEAAIDQQRTQADTAAPSAMSGVASAAQAPLPAPTLALATATLVPTETTTPTSTDTATLTNTPLPTASATATLFSTPAPAEALASDTSIVGVGLIVVALLLFGFAIVTTILRRRS